MTYKGYSARPEYSAEDGAFFGRLLGINDLVNFESANAEGLEEEFHKAVDDYLNYYAENPKITLRVSIGDAMFIADFDGNKQTH